MPPSDSRFAELSQISPPHVPLADHLAQPQPSEPVREGLPVGRRLLVDEHHHVAPEGVLHVPTGLAGASLPVHPGLTHQLLENEAVDVAAAVVPDIDNQALTVEDGIEVAVPLVDVVAAHRAEVDVPDLALAGGLDLHSACVLPVRVAEVQLVPLRDDDHVARGTGLGVAHPEQNLLADLIAQQRADVRHVERSHTVDGLDHVAVRDVQVGIGERSPLVRIIGLALVDVVDQIPALVRRANESRPERGHADVVVAASQVAAADAGVERRKLTDHAPDQVRELVARRYAVDEREVLVAHAVQSTPCIPGS